MINKKQRGLKNDICGNTQEYGVAYIRGLAYTGEKQYSLPYTFKEIKDNLLSVIIPVYNAEQTLKRCVESILQQTYNNLELLLVDDGSTDSSPDICDMFSEMDDRVRVYHIENSGPAEARNVGLLHMRGQYLAFVDADDYLESDMYEIMIRTIQKEHVQMAICNWKNHILNKNICTDSNIGNCGRVKAELLRRIVAAENIIGGGGYPWNRVIDWKYVLESGCQDILFPYGIVVYEDKIWVLHILDLIKDVILLPDTKYHYMIDTGSLSHRNASCRLWDTLHAWKLIDKEFKYNLPPEVVMARSRMTLHLLWEVAKERKITLLREAWPECVDIVKYATHSIKGKIKYFIVKILVKIKCSAFNKI